jgi:hypothetical protein
VQHERERRGVELQVWERNGGRDILNIFNIFPSKTTPINKWFVILLFI